MSGLYVLEDYVAPRYDGGAPGDVGELCYAAEITTWDAATQTAHVQYVSSAPFVTSATDTPAHTAFDPCIQQPALMRQMIFDASRTFGASQISYGEMTLINADGHLDGWRAYGLDGRALVLRIGRPGMDYPNSWTTTLTALMDLPQWDERLLALRLRSPMARLDRELPMTRYAGTNVLPNGLEGTANDIGGQYKPRAYGWPQNISPPIVNTARLIYQLNDNGYDNAGQFYDRGALLSPGAIYSSQASLETNAPSAGTYTQWPAGGYIRLGSPPAGQVTGSVRVDTAVQTAATILRALAIEAGIDANDIVAADVTALGAARGTTVGLWLDAPTTARAAMDQVAESVGACYWFDADGRLRMAEITSPSGNPVVVLTADTIVSISLQTPVPARQIQVHYWKNWTVQTTDLAGSATAEYRASVAQEWRTALANGASVIDHPGADVWSIDTLLVYGAQPTQFAQLFGVPRDLVTLRVRVEPDVLRALELNAVVQVVYPRFGYDSGKLMRVTGIEMDLRLKRVDLTLWG